MLNDSFMVYHEVIMALNDSFMVHQEVLMVLNDSFMVHQEVLIVLNNSFMVHQEVLMVLNVSLIITPKNSRSSLQDLCFVCYWLLPNERSAGTKTKSRSDDHLVEIDNGRLTMDDEYKGIDIKSE